MSIGFWQIAIVVVLVVLLFGRGKISDLMGDVAKGIKSFKKGISENPDVRFDVAKKIVERAADFGIPREDVVVAPLIMPVGAINMAGRSALDLIARLRNELKVNTTCGASNISFGLPNRHGMNAAFLSGEENSDEMSKSSGKIKYKSNQDGGISKKELKEKISNLNFTLKISDSIDSAIRSNSKDMNAITLVCGSLYLIGEVLNLN